MHRHPCLPLLLSFLVFSAASCCLAAFQNVTTLLDNHPDHSNFNGLLSRYGVAAQINSRTTITVLCPPNRAIDDFMSTQGSAPDRQTMFNILSFHVLLDYEDLPKMRSLPGGLATITTLFQTTGLATDDNGFVNITSTADVVKVRHSGTTTFATVGSALELFPFNISLLAIDVVLVPSGISGPAPPPVNITQIISQAGNFSRFMSLLLSTGVDKVFQSHDTRPGVTIFAPTNAAFDRLGSDTLNRLTKAQMVALMEFHAIGSFFPTEELATASGPQATLASGSGGGAFTVTMSQSKSGIISVDAGSNKVPIAGTLYSNNPVAIFVLGSVLRATEIFGRPSPAPLAAAPSPAALAATPSKSQSPTPPSSSSSTSPAPSLVVSTPPTSVPAPSLVVSTPPTSVPASSPPAPVLGTFTPGLAPSNGPEASSPESPTSASDPALHFPIITFFLALAFHFLI